MIRGLKRHGRQQLAAPRAPSGGYPDGAHLFLGLGLRGGRGLALAGADGHALQALGAPFAAVDILPDPRIRQELSAISNWPTIPQLFVKGELVGGCDIVTEMFESGELAEVLGVPDAAEAEAPAPGAPAPMGIENRLG